ncbi:hypothetical protein EG329_009427 [Mollisiaceae sp. DMI_Dod_QoI]|nr:hypothetical protein EG329_009427 [Helotiales sp. DMI_Dod_QoI]
METGHLRGAAAELRDTMEWKRWGADELKRQTGESQHAHPGWLTSSTTTAWGKPSGEQTDQYTAGPEASQRSQCSQCRVAGTDVGPKHESDNGMGGPTPRASRPEARLPCTQSRRTRKDLGVAINKKQTAVDSRALSVVV